MKVRKIFRSSLVLLSSLFLIATVIKNFVQKSNTSNAIVPEMEMPFYAGPSEGGGEDPFVDSDEGTFS